MSLGNGNPKEGDKGSNFNYELKVLQGLQAIAVGLENQSKYKVYTALLTQSGGDNPQTQTNGAVQVGVSYIISSAIGPEPDWDFSNVGGPIAPDNYSFIATSSDVPNNYGPATLNYNTGAPVVTVLENTIGNIWFTYNVAGEYFLNTNGELTVAKTIALITPNFSTGYNAIGVGYGNSDFLSITTISLGGSILPQNNALYNTPIEIRVYN